MLCVPPSYTLAFVLVIFFETCWSTVVINDRLFFVLTTLKETISPKLTSTKKSDNDHMLLVKLAKANWQSSNVRTLTKGDLDARVVIRFTENSLQHTIATNIQCHSRDLFRLIVRTQGYLVGSNLTTRCISYSQPTSLFRYGRTLSFSTMTSRVTRISANICPCLHLLANYYTKLTKRIWCLFLRKESSSWLIRKFSLLEIS